MEHNLIIYHVVCSSDAKHCTKDAEVMYECIFSNHHPMLGRVNLNILPECEENHSNDLKQRIHWDKLPDNIIRFYERGTNDGFNNITIPSGVKCTHPNCLQANHGTDIDNLFDAIISVRNW